MPFVVPSSSSPSVDLALDPEEVAVDRTELPINVSPIRVAEAGIDWGDAQIEAYMAEAARGQVPVDFRVPNRTITIPIIYGPAESAALAAAKVSLRAKVARIQQEGGWLRRSEGRYCDIVNATLREPDRNSYLGYETDVVLTLEAIPDFYGDEVELDDIVETSAAEIAQVLRLDAADAVIEGDYPGRVRIVVDEDDGETQLGLLWGFRSRHYSSAATAALAYEAEDLTPLDSAAVATVSGASGGASNNAIAHTTSSALWTNMLSTNIVGVGAMTHTGTYRVFVRARCTGDTASLRLLWNAGDFVNPVPNTAAEIPSVSEFHILDLGEIRIDRAPVGSHRWEGRFQRLSSGSVTAQIDKIWVVPVDDGAGLLTAPLNVQEPTTIVASDGFTSTTSGSNLNGRSAVSGGTWATSGATTDYAFSDTAGALSRECVTRGTTSDASARLAVLGSTNFSDFALFADIYRRDEPFVEGESFEFGIGARYVDASNHLRVTLKFHEDTGFVPVRTLEIVQRVAGTDDTLDSETCFFPSGEFVQIRLFVYATGRVVAEVVDDTGAVLATAAALSSALASGGALASGKPILYDRSQTTNSNILRAWDNIAGYSIDPGDAIAYGGRSVQITSEGVYRETADGTAIGTVTPIGDLPRIPPSGMEERPVELFVKPTRSDMDGLPDAGIDDFSTRVYYRPSWLFPM